MTGERRRKRVKTQKPNRMRRAGLVFLAVGEPVFPAVAMRAGELRVAGACWSPLCFPVWRLLCSGRARAQTDPCWMLSREGQVGKGTALCG